MGEFYGTLKGNRGEATRLGSKASGIRTTAETWGSVIRTEYYPDHEAKIIVQSKYGDPAVRMWLKPDDLVRANAEAPEEIQPEIEALMKAVDALNVKVAEVLK